jgi:acyl carrier protein
MKDRVINILTEIRPEFDFTQSVNFIKEGLLDSFDVFNLVNALDEEFKISIDGMDIVAENFSSVEKIIALLHKNGAAI